MDNETNDGAKRDVVVIGASAGGIETLSALVEQLPEDFPAPIFVVVHVAPDHDSKLPEILQRAGHLAANHAVDGEAIRPGQIYVAPPDRHLLLDPDRVRVERGPAENGHRPAVDPLFRTAARAFGPRVTGVILSGGFDDGTAGLLSIKARGGIAVVQDPDDAINPQMPRSALRHVAVDHLSRLADLGPLLTRLVREPVPLVPSGAPAIDESLAHLEGSVLGLPAELVCPACGGVMTEAVRGEFSRFRCHTGHAYSARSVIAGQAEALENALWAAMRAMEESESLSRRLATRNAPRMAKRFLEKANAMKEHSELLRQLVLGGHDLSREDAREPLGEMPRLDTEAH